MAGLIYLTSFIVGLVVLFGLAQIMVAIAYAIMVEIQVRRRRSDNHRRLHP